MTKEELIAIFSKKKYLLDMGAGKLSKMFNCNIEEIYAVKNKIRSNIYNKKVPPKPKILLLDIETSPMRAYIWNRWNQYVSVDQTISEWFCICWSAKWLGSNEVFGDVLTSQEILEENDSTIMKSLWKVLDEANIVITHNGKRFDIPRINTRFILHNLPPTSSYTQIDTLEIARKNFSFSSNKLGALAQMFNIPTKLDTSFSLWSRCLQGDETALNYMLEYNKRDIEVLEGVYLKLLPWIKNHPNIGLYNNTKAAVCPNCGSAELTDIGFHYTNSNKYMLYRCKCGAISRVRVGELTKGNKPIMTNI